MILVYAIFMLFYSLFMIVKLYKMQKKDLLVNEVTKEEEKKLYVIMFIVLGLLIIVLSSCSVCTTCRASFAGGYTRNFASSKLSIIFQTAKFFLIFLANAPWYRPFRASDRGLKPEAYHRPVGARIDILHHVGEGA